MLLRGKKVFFRKVTIFLSVFFLTIFLLPSSVNAAPSGCVGVDDSVRSCCGTTGDPRVSDHSGWSCQDTSRRSGGADDCASNLCHGGASVKCCPPSEGDDGDADAGGGSVRGSLRQTASGAGLNTGRTVSGIIRTVISTILGFVGVIFLVLVIAGGLMWMTAGGNEEQVGKSKKLLVNATIGVVIVMLSYLLVTFVMGQIVG